MKKSFNNFYQRTICALYVGGGLVGVVYCLFTAVNSLNWPKRRDQEDFWERALSKMTKICIPRENAFL